MVWKLRLCALSCGGVGHLQDVRSPGDGSYRGDCMLQLSFEKLTVLACVAILSYDLPISGAWAQIHGISSSMDSTIIYNS